MLKRRITSIISIILILVLSLSLFSCSKKPSEKTFKEAQRDSIEEFISDFKTSYEKSLSKEIGNISANYDIDFELSEELISMLRSLTTENLNWLNDVTLELTQNVKDDMTSVDLAIDYNKKSLLSATAIANTVTGDFYFAVPMLAEKYLKMNLNELMGGSGELSAISIAETTEIMKLYPSPELVEHLLLTNYDIIMAGITDVAFEKSEISICGVAEECIVYEATLTRAQIMQIVINVLENIGKDEKIKEYLLSTGDKLLELIPNLNYEDVNKLYSGFTESINEAVEEVKDNLENNEGNDKTALKWISYTTKKAEVIATELQIFVDDENKETKNVATIFAGKTQDKENIGVQVYFEKSGERVFEIEGNLTEKKNLQSGTYEISVNEQSMLFIDVTDLNVKDLDNGYINGSFKLCPSKGLLDLISSKTGATNGFGGLTFASLAIQLDITQTKGNETKLVATLLNSGAPYFSVSIDSKIGNNADNITLPTNNNVTNNTESWVMGMDFDALVEKMKECGMPDSIVDLVEGYATILDNIFHQ